MFKNEFKHYKRRYPPPDLSGMINFSGEESTEKVIQRQPCDISDASLCTKLGLVDSKQWKIFELKTKPGLIYIMNPFITVGQRYWIEQCLQVYTKKPNRLNLDSFNELNADEDWWETTQSNDLERSKSLLNKLRWATLGYHHNWNTKEYSEDAHSEFPRDLAELSKLIVQVVEGCEASAAYQAEAAIVNFYHLDSTLSGHKDISEPNLDSPLLSISFGQSAIFLVGGDTLEDPVIAMMLHSGDIVMMSGSARQCYHGVPRIVQTQAKPWISGVDDWESDICAKYISNSRININVRKVLKPGQLSVNS